jgi:hypothetical protein
MDARRLLSAGIATAALAAVAGCGGDHPTPTTTTASRTATGVGQLAERLTAYTGVRAEAETSDYTADEVRLTDQVGSERFGAPRITWTKDAEQRRRDLGAARPAADGWYESDDGEELAMPFGPHVVLSGFDVDREPGRPRDLQAAARAVKAAYEGRPELLPAAERSCELQKLSPLHDAKGACAFGGVPTAFTSAPEALRTGVLEIAVTGAEVTDEVGAGSVLPVRAGDGEQLLVVGYRVTNRTRQDLISDVAALRAGGRVHEADRPATLAAGPYIGAVAPGESADRVAVFRLPTALAGEAREHGALVVPTGLHSSGLLTGDVGQGWIRLGGAPSKLPGSASPSSPQQQQRPAAPPGPPKIPVKEGSGVAYGEAARAAYHASMFFPIPANFRRGPVRAGTVAGDCTVPAPTAADRDQIAAMARAAYPKDNLHGIADKSLLLAECGAMGDFGIVFWGHDRNGHDVISGVELKRSGGRWVENKGKFYPGCTIPLDAAAAWQIDVSACPKNAPRPHPRGELH